MDPDAPSNFTMASSVLTVSFLDASGAPVDVSGLEEPAQLVPDLEEGRASFGSWFSGAVSHRLHRLRSRDAAATKVVFWRSVTPQKTCRLRSRFREAAPAGLEETLRGELEVHGEAQDVRAQQVCADEPGHELLRLRVHAEALVTGACLVG